MAGIPGMDPETFDTLMRIGYYAGLGTLAVGGAAGIYVTGRKIYRSVFPKKPRPDTEIDRTVTFDAAGRPRRAREVRRERYPRN